MQPIEARSYDQLLDALRQRVAELAITGATLDEVAGLSDRYGQKLIGKRPTKYLGRMSLGAVLGALGLKLTVSVDEEAFRRVRHRLTPRKMCRAVNGTSARPALDGLR
jgi:hypothetical protein